MLAPPFVEGFVEIGNWTVIGAPLTLFDEQVEVLFMDTIISPKVALSQVPEVLYAVDVISSLRKEL